MESARGSYGRGSKAAQQVGPRAHSQTYACSAPGTRQDGAARCRTATRKLRKLLVASSFTTQRPPPALCGANGVSEAERYLESRHNHASLQPHALPPVLRVIVVAACGRVAPWGPDAVSSCRPRCMLAAEWILGKNNIAFMSGPTHKALRKSFLALFTRKALGVYVLKQDGIIRDHFAQWMQVGTAGGVRRVQGSTALLCA